MKKFYILIIFLFICTNCYSANTQKVSVEPRRGGISFNTITLTNAQTQLCPATPMKGRTTLHILNTSTTENVFFTDVSGSSVKGTLYPRERASFNIGSEVDVYASGNSVSLQVWEVR